MTVYGVHTLRLPTPLLDQFPDSFLVMRAALLCCVCMYVRPCFLNVLCSIFLTKLKKSGRENKKLKIDPGSVSGACLWPLIDKKVFQQLVINLK